MNTIEIQKTKELLLASNKIVIVSHRNPDGDAIGSSLGLYHYLSKMGHQVTVIFPNEYPKFLAWMPGVSEAIIFEKDEIKAKNILQQAELIFTLDFNALHRLGSVMEITLLACQASYIMIDHHQLPDDYANVIFSDTSYGSTCEMIYEFINYLGDRNIIDKTIATCLYTGIVTDSGSFRFPKTTGNTHRIIAEFIDLGVENTSIHNLLYDNQSISALQLLGRGLQNMVVLPQYQTAYITLSSEELQKFNYQKGDTEGIVNYGLSIEGIHLAAIFIENKDENIIKISFRSQGSFDVNQFAREHFQGGGHMNAAGGKSYDTLEETVTKFMTQIKIQKELIC
jgi:bifunctional oligoribonuclease and PAP phosphatase NrnA